MRGHGPPNLWDEAGDEGMHDEMRGEAGRWAGACHPMPLHVQLKGQG